MAQLNRVYFTTETTGTGSDIVVNAAFSQAFCTPAEAGVTDGQPVTFMVEQGTDFALYRGTYDAGTTAVSRDAVVLSKISGSAGASDLNLDGSATVRFVHSAERINSTHSLATLAYLGS